MKKIILGLFTVFVLFMLAGCFGKLTTYEEISYDKLMEKFDNKEDFVLFIGSHDCSHCQNYKPKLDAVIKVHQVKVYYIDVANLTTQENTELEKHVAYNGTPYTACIENGKLKEVGDDKQIYVISGDRDIDYIERILKKNGYIKE